MWWTWVMSTSLKSVIFTWMRSMSVSSIYVSIRNESDYVFLRFHSPKPKKKKTYDWLRRSAGTCTVEREKKAANNRKFSFRAVHDLIRSTNSIVPYIFFSLSWCDWTNMYKKKLLFSFHWRFNGQFVRYLFFFYMYDFIEIDIIPILNGLCQWIKHFFKWSYVQHS